MSVEIKTKVKTGGLAGVTAGDSAICLCGVEEQSLRYRGYAIEDLAKYGSFEETAWLLLRGSLPNQKELATYQQRLMGLRKLPEGLCKVLELIPPQAHMMEVLRTAVSVLGNYEPEVPSSDQFAVADRLIATLPGMLLYWHHFHHSGRRISTDSPAPTVAGHFLTLLNGKAPTELLQKTMDVTLILYAEHEFNASTFTVRTIASTLSDFWSSITGGIGALRGPLHGGANEEALKLIELYKTVEGAELGILQRLQDKALIMGFGHRVYTRSDPRSPIVKEMARHLSTTHQDGYLFAIAERIEAVMWREKHLFPNLDFYSSLVYRFCNIPMMMFTPLFVISRISGWSAHLLEQRQNNKLIRPLSHYTGPESMQWNPMELRNVCNDD